MFDRVAQIINACAIYTRVGGQQASREYEWAEVASNAYRDFPFTHDQMRQMSILHRSVRKHFFN